ncbi:hypothetical protein GPECTOR_87g414 [Gonium pectorale]|uniref:Uncharacterized protein n=1 Tax=Gonium pectorale TaxID=33097 RepID=A0A150G124_GONPE|nr:hypothetical protein GPECTOR_87g414 [Gonium pectorale]|eukprot:KXZ43552.1 hypothetical protein GPECTOR_87g414 [Gonium pectorale]
MPERQAAAAACCTASRAGGSPAAAASCTAPPGTAHSQLVAGGGGSSGGDEDRRSGAGTPRRPRPEAPPRPLTSRVLPLLLLLAAVSTAEPPAAAAAAVTSYTAAVTLYSATATFNLTAHCPSLQYDILLQLPFRPSRLTCDVLADGAGLTATVAFPPTATGAAGMVNLLSRLARPATWRAAATLLHPACGWGASVLAASPPSAQPQLDVSVFVCTDAGYFWPNTPPQLLDTAPDMPCNAELLLPDWSCPAPPAAPSGPAPSCLTAPAALAALAPHGAAAAVASQPPPTVALAAAAAAAARPAPVPPEPTPDPLLLTVLLPPGSERLANSPMGCDVLVGAMSAFSAFATGSAVPLAADSILCSTQLPDRRAGFIMQTAAASLSMGAAISAALAVSPILLTTLAGLPCGVALGLTATGRLRPRAGRRASP